MTGKQREIILKFLLDLESLNRQRRLWMVFSSVVFFGIIGLIFYWQQLDSMKWSYTWWAVGSVGLIVALNWWYWTMSLIRRIISHQLNIVGILTEITIDIKNVKEGLVSTWDNLHSLK